MRRNLDGKTQTLPFQLKMQLLVSQNQTSLLAQNTAAGFPKSNFPASPLTCSSICICPAWSSNSSSRSWFLASNSLLVFLRLATSMTSLLPWEPTSKISWLSCSHWFSLILRSPFTSWGNRWYIYSFNKIAHTYKSTTKYRSTSNGGDYQRPIRPGVI